MHTLTQPPWWTVLLTSFPLAEMQNWDLNSNSLYCSVSLCIPSQKWPFLKREKSGTCMNQPFLLGITQRKKKITLRTTKHWSRLHGWLCSLCLWRFSSQTKPWSSWSELSVDPVLSMRWDSLTFKVPCSVSVILHWGIISRAAISRFSVGNSVFRSETNFCNGKLHRGSNPKPQPPSPSFEEFQNLKYCFSRVKLSRINLSNMFNTCSLTKSI